MADKKYIDFPAGSYDTNKIFLQADPVTGDLEKVNLPAVTNTHINCLQIFGGPFTNIAGVDTDVCSIVMPGNTLANNGDTLYGMVQFSTTGATAKTFRVFVGTQEISATGVTTANNYYYEYWLTRYAASSYNMAWRQQASTTYGAGSVNTGSSINLNNDQTLFLRLQSTANAVISVKFCYYQILQVSV